MQAKSTKATNLRATLPNTKGHLNDEEAKMSHLPHLYVCTQYILK